MYSWIQIKVKQYKLYSRMDLVKEEEEWRENMINCKMKVKHPRALNDSKNPWTLDKSKAPLNPW